MQRLTCVALDPKLSDLGVLLGGVLAVFHVSEVVLMNKSVKAFDGRGRHAHLAFGFILVDVREVVFGEFKSNGQENVQRVEHFRVERLRVQIDVSKPQDARIRKRFSPLQTPRSQGGSPGRLWDVRA